MRNAMMRVLDVAIAGTALVAAAPVLAVASAAIVLESRGPVLFRQERVGMAKRAIHVLKLRTMVADASSRGPAITVGGDPRITRVGRLLRRTKLDELPQLWNIVRGDMSLVGPRPEVPQYVRTYGSEWNDLFSVRPGLTDLATLVFRDEETLLARASNRERAYREVILPMKLALALQTVRQSTVRNQLGLLVRTAVAIVRGHDEQQSELLAEAQRRIDALES